MLNQLSIGIHCLSSFRSTRCSLKLALKVMFHTNHLVTAACDGTKNQFYLPRFSNKILCETYEKETESISPPGRAEQHG